LARASSAAATLMPSAFATFRPGCACA
jgi:hypothetical protein